MALSMLALPWYLLMVHSQQIQRLALQPFLAHPLRHELATLLLLTGSDRLYLGNYTARESKKRSRHLTPRPQPNETSTPDR
ncbi:hypothetical protein IWX49DRAFT_584370 [Phyllosticta citricarpa]